MKKTILLLILCCMLGSFTQAQITRGASPGEIYIASSWYYSNCEYEGVFYSADNGKTLSVQCKTFAIPPSGEIKLGKLIGDATPGVLYNMGQNKLWVSFDYGKNWEFRENYINHTGYWGGQFEGKIYKGIYYLNSLYKSNDYAMNFEIVSNPPNCPKSDVGYLDGEFYGLDGNEEEGYYLYHSFDYDSNYTKINLDSTVVTYWPVIDFDPKICRGAEPGELYLISWWFNMQTGDSNYKIFHSFDSGYTWTEKYVSGNTYGEFFTAGKEPGSFYVLDGDILGDHVRLFIKYSSDYGETFTTYIHELDSTYTSFTAIQKPDFELSAFPNPFSDKTTIKFELPINYENTVLKIYNITGKPIRQFNITGKKSQQWDGRDNNGNLVKKGIYFYNINYGNISSKLNKILFIN